MVERTLGSAALRACASSASASAFLAASSRAFRSSSSFIRSMSPLRMYFVGRGGTLSRAFRLEAISALRASMMVVLCAKIYYLSRVVPSLFASFYSELLLQHHHNVRRRRRSEVRPRQKVTVLRGVSNSCFCAANSFFRPLGLMVRGYATSLRFAWSLTTLPYSPLPLHQSDEALVGHALFWKIQPSPDSTAKLPKLHGLLQMYLS